MENLGADDLASLFCDAGFIRPSFGVVGAFWDVGRGRHGGRATGGASRVGGLPESVVDGKTGPLVEPDDYAALADAILQLISDRKKALAAWVLPAAIRLR
jgi:glycosyltransferase involved in cell wall biosynthesis